MSRINHVWRYVPKKQLSVIGVPLHRGQPREGVDLGPDAIRASRFMDNMTEWKIDDKGNLTLSPENFDEGDPRCKHLGFIGDACRRLCHVTYDAVASEQFSLMLGGDHSVGLGSVAGALKARPDLGVIWVDAHADINSPQITNSGNVHGMPVAMLMDVHNTRTQAGLEWMTEMKVPVLDDQRLVYIGLRDLDVGEKVVLKERGIKCFTMHDIDRYGIGKVMEMALDHVCGRVERPLHLSYDVDAVDPNWAPGTGTTVVGGLTYREAFYVPEALSATGLMCSMDMVEVNPTLEDVPGYDSGFQTSTVAGRLVQAALGDAIL